MDIEENTIKIGDHVVVQRQGYTKLHKLKAHSRLILGSFNIEMDNIIGEKYFDTFQMKNTPGSKNYYLLEKVEQANSATDSLNIEKSGIDNRHISNNNQDSQGLSKDDIDKLKDEELSSNNIVGQLINNSKTFAMKTGYSQEKYIKKKEKKYFEYVQIKKPTIRILAQMFYRQDPTKTLGIRIDDLSQIMTYANIHSEGNHLLYDSGTSGLMTAAILNAIGPNTAGQLVHMHPGNECQRNGFIAMQFPKEQTERCVNVNLYSVIRCFHQNKDTFTKNDTESGEPTAKRQKLDVDNLEKQDSDSTDLEAKPQSLQDSYQKVDNTTDLKAKPQSSENQDSDQKVDKTSQKKSWQLDNEKACKILQQKVDSLIITAKEHPVNIVKELLPFLQGNRNFVVFSLYKELQQELYSYLKSRTDILNIRILNSFMRNYQVLPNRTHPEVNMTTGGYILTAYKLNV